MKSEKIGVSVQKVEYETRSLESILKLINKNKISIILFLCSYLNKEIFLCPLERIMASLKWKFPI